MKPGEAQKTGEAQKKKTGEAQALGRNIKLWGRNIKLWGHTGGKFYPYPNNG